MYLSELFGILLLVALYLFGTLISAAWQLPAPGAVLGLVLCAAAMLASTRLRARIRPGAIVLLGLIPLFLVPVLARMAVRIDFAAAETWGAVALLCVASLAGIVVTGLFARLCLPRR
jgi:holin-like protein